MLITLTLIEYIRRISMLAEIAEYPQEGGPPGPQGIGLPAASARTSINLPPRAVCNRVLRRSPPNVIPRVRMLRRWRLRIGTRVAFRQRVRGHVRVPPSGSDGVGSLRARRGVHIADLIALVDHRLSPRSRLRSVAHVPLIGSVIADIVIGMQVLSITAKVAAIVSHVETVVAQVLPVGTQVSPVSVQILLVGANVRLVALDVALIVRAVTLVGGTVSAIVAAQVLPVGTQVSPVSVQILLVRTNVRPVALDVALIVGAITLVGANVRLVAFDVALIVRAVTLVGGTVVTLPAGTVVVVVDGTLVTLPVSTVVVGGTIVTLLAGTGTSGGRAAIVAA
jgi:hypothetical protein